MANRPPRTHIVALIAVVLTALVLATGAGARSAAHAAAHPQARAHHRQTTEQRHRRDHKKAHHKKAHHKKAHHKKAHHKKHKARHGKGKRRVKKPTSVAVSAKDPAATAETASKPGDPLAGQRFYVYPYDSAVQEYNTLVSQGDTNDAAQIAKIASQPEAVWLTDDGSASVVPGIMSAAATSGAEPVFVVYNIPDRDCSGGYSSGGASDASDYEAFINSIVSGLGQGKVVVIIEPDALSNLGDGCLSSSEQQTYYQLIGYAAQHLDSDVNASVYVDAGNPGWLPAQTEASELQQALGSTQAGFAVNVSNFAPTATDIAYGTEISQDAGGRHFVVDTSRNGGNAASGQWCNPPGAGIGVDPTTATGNSLVDAFLWIKDVGESDGTCNGGPAAGQFWLSYALSLVANG